ncbi:MAG: DUF1223 domain-containing protein [Pseudomonadota bacterium]
MAAVRTTVSVLAIFFGGVLANDARAEDILEPAPQPVVVEMFLSQACESCPPAAEIANELADRGDVLVLSWHVNYWDNVRHRKNGRWIDPFAKAAFVERQSVYNQQIRGKRRNFTPQAVINGSVSVVGSKREKLDKTIDEARYPVLGQRITMTMRPEGGYAVSFQNMPVEAEAALVTYRLKARTHVDGGGNKGRVFEEANVVENVVALNADVRSADAVAVDAPASGRGCAVLVRDTENSALIAAAECPTIDYAAAVSE